MREDRLHSLRWQAGDLVAVDHGAVRDPAAPCAALTAAWARHAEDLGVLTLASRDAPDAEVVGTGPVGVRRPQPPGLPPARPRPTPWTLIPRPPPGARGVAFATIVDLGGSAPPPVDGHEPLRDITALLALGEGLAERLVATVAGRWADRLDAEPDLAVPAALTAAVHGRAASALRAWWNTPDLAVEITMVRTGGAHLERSAERVHLTVPVRWLADVWCRDAAVVDDRFVLAVHEADQDHLLVRATDRDLTTEHTRRLPLPLAPLAPAPPPPPPAPSPPVAYDEHQANAPHQKRLSSGSVVRTSFSDQATWDAIRDTITAETDEGFLANVGVVDDPTYGGATIDDLLAATGEHALGFLVLVDDVAVTEPDHPVLVVSLAPRNRGEHFRSIPSGIQSIENNLSIANMDWADFANAVDHRGIFRGF
jgi:hypothetical protein